MPKDPFNYDDPPPAKSFHYLSSNGHESSSLSSPSDGSPTKTIPAQAVVTKADAVKQRKRHRIIGAIAISLLLLIAVAVTIGVVLGTRTSSSNNEASTTGIGSSRATASGGATTGGKLWGVGGDTITTEDGTKFLYNNTLGGTWVAIPFNDTARPQSDQPALSERWDYAANRILGVNLGGWLVLEPFITPALFEPYANLPTPIVDEWGLSVQLGKSLASTLEDHYSTFITEQDFAQIAAAGLNWVRLPVGWWMMETWSGEPLLEGVCFKYFLKAITWARKYGLRINLDFHAVPGSQNGWNHSGKFGTIGFLHGAMGIANAQRSLNYIRTLAEFISQPQYKNVVPMFSVLNEAQLSIIGSAPLRSWYYQVYQLLRMIGGVGEGNGPFMVIHDGFGGSGGGQRGWDTYLPGADRLGLDTHSYLCFGPQNTDSMGYNSMKPCLQWAPLFNETLSGFGLNVGGEFSLAVNDCGLFVNNVGFGTRYEGTYPTPATADGQFKKMGTCESWLDHRQWSAATKEAFADLAQTTQDSMRNSFFWTWKIGKSLNQDNPPNPMWNYLNGLQNGYIRPDARASNGRCVDVVTAQGGTSVVSPWSGKLATWQTGGAGAGVIDATVSSAYAAFPPAQILGAPNGGSYQTASLPKYVQTGALITLKPLPIAGVSSSALGTGWTQPNDTAKAFVPQPGCNYPDPWGGVGIAPPTPVCGN
ncbi:family 5 glycoside hydrolase [Melampsora larici-populina 98AG31]|uniref:glucan 1,3-beta-glucosidase n=1 Tax=Melampsora larici-populina (strain 98AG31 / pathotype 3-4-7) TaxID=747676 RepID=F4RA41_MELLP|nr:family 5 glycoside hydrolase [Melampsora larici-populina 98AG31]EGG10416.1 family 5 glycoside hydrolase [Melampsora larici-populina 98AG31]